MSTPAQQLHQHLAAQLGRSVFGMEPAVRGLATAFIAGGHVLVQGVPGLGKTLLAKRFAALLEGRFARVQCTADLMPSDITGVHVYRADSGQFELLLGPVFADVLLVDEINRTGPKTQSALLEAMEERRVTIDRSSYDLPARFMVIASQNPLDFEGTFPLPESQIDRFLLRLVLDYPEGAVERAILMAYDKPGGGHDADVTPEPLPANLVEQAREQTAAVHVSEALYDYATGIAAASRVHPQVSLGVSTRGAINLMRCARAEAAMRGAEFATPDDIKAVAPQVLPHRLVLSPDAALEGVSAEAIVADLLAQVPVPR